MRTALFLLAVAYCGESSATPDDAVESGTNTDARANPGTSSQQLVDVDGAVKYVDGRCRAGDPESCERLADIYTDGSQQLGIAPDTRLARVYSDLTLSATMKRKHAQCLGGHVIGCEELARLNLHGSSDLGVERSDEKAIEYCTIANGWRARWNIEHPESAQKSEACTDDGKVIPAPTAPPVPEGSTAAAPRDHAATSDSGR